MEDKWVTFLGFIFLLIALTGVSIAVFWGYQDQPLTQKQSCAIDQVLSPAVSPAARCEKYMRKITPTEKIIRGGGL